MRSRYLAICGAAVSASIALLLHLRAAHASSHADDLSWSTDVRPARALRCSSRSTRRNLRILGEWPGDLGLPAAAGRFIQRQLSPTERHDRNRRSNRAPPHRVPPEAITRIYVGPDFVVREKLFVPIDAPAAIVTYEVEGVRPIDILVRFNPVLNLMWPGAIGGQETSWQAIQLGLSTNRTVASILRVHHIARPHRSRRDTERQSTHHHASGVAFTIRAQQR